MSLLQLPSFSGFNLNKGFVFSIIFVAFLVMSLPVGVYLVQQSQDVRSRASSGGIVETEKQSSLQAGFNLVDRGLSEEGLLRVDLRARVEEKKANFFSTKISFPPGKLEVVSIATVSAVLAGDSSSLLRPVEATSDNKNGFISFSAGYPNPGLETDSGQEINLATINFKPLQEGAAQMRVTEGSAIYASSDNSNILNLPNPTLDVSLAGFTNQVLTQKSPVSRVKTSPKKISLSLFSPEGGKNYSYYTQLPVKWKSSGVDQVDVSLYRNGSFFGRLISDIPASGEFGWEPTTSLPLIYINNKSVFYIELRGKDSEGKELLVAKGQPFSLSLDPSISTSGAALTYPGGQSEITLDIGTFSRLFSNYDRADFDDSVDLNSDGVVNDIDLWILRNIMIAGKIIQ